MREWILDTQSNAFCLMEVFATASLLANSKIFVPLAACYQKSGQLAYCSFYLKYCFLSESRIPGKVASKHFLSVTFQNECVQILSFPQGVGVQQHPTWSLGPLRLWL